MSESAEARTLKDWRTKVYFESQAEFAERLDVATSVLSLWETGARVPRFKSQRAIAQKLGLRPDQIIWPEQRAGKEEAA